VIKQIAAAISLAPSRRPPFLARRYSYRDQKMKETLGPALSEPTVWTATDPHPEGRLAEILEDSPGLHKWPHYLPIYESALDTTRPIRMLEIGVFHGGSLTMWRRYLHPESVIVGIDIDAECRRFDDPANDVHVRIGSQADPDFLQAVVDEFGPFDVILDDGSHMTSHMVESFQHLFDGGLVEGGVYLAEDVHTNYWRSYRDTKSSFVDFVGALIDAMHAHYHHAQGEPKFRVGGPERLPSIEVPRITPVLSGIEIHDSIVVVRKARRDLPSTVYITR
jgi:hypothetical protein